MEVGLSLQSICLSSIFSPPLKVTVYRHLHRWDTSDINYILTQSARSPPLLREIELRFLIVVLYTFLNIFIFEYMWGIFCLWDGFRWIFSKTWHFPCLKEATENLLPKQTYSQQGQRIFLCPSFCAIIARIFFSFHVLYFSLTKAHTAYIISFVPNFIPNQERRDRYSACKRKYRKKHCTPWAPALPWGGHGLG